MRVYNPKTKQFEETENNSNNRQSGMSSNVYNPSTKQFESNEEINQQNENNGWFKKSNGNGIQTAAGTAADVGYNAFVGPGKKMEGWENSLFYWLGDLFEGIGWDSAAKIAKQNAGQSRIDKTMAPVKETIDSNSVLGDRTDNLIQNVSGTAYQAALTSAVPGGVAGQTAASSAMMFADAYSNARTQALREGATEDEAKAYGNIAGLSEAATELMFGGLGKFNKAVGVSKSGLPVDDAAANLVSKAFKSRLAKNLAQYGVKAAGEGFEEVASGFLQAVGKKMTYKKEEDLKKLIEDEDLLNAFIDGAIVSGIMQIPGKNGIISTTKSGRDFLTGYTTQEQNFIDSETNKRINEQINEDKTLSNKKQKNIREEVENDYNEGKITLPSTTDKILPGIGNDEINRNILQKHNENHSTEALIKEIQNKTKNNLKEMEGIEYASIEDVAPLTGRKGDRGNNEEYETNYKNYIRNNGIDKPILLQQQNDGTIKVYDGNHRLEIANYFGLKEIPVKFINKDIKVEDYNKILYNNSNKERNAFAEGEFDNDNKRSEKISQNNERNWVEQENGIDNNIPFRYSGATEQNDRISNQEYGDNRGSSSLSIYGGNSEQSRSVLLNSKTLNPNEISQLTPIDALTTPNLPIKNRNITGEGDSSFFNNIKDKTNMLNDEQKQIILDNDDIKYYDKITNKESLNEAFGKLNKDGIYEATRWFNKSSEDATATDVAEGWILLKQYADDNNTDGMVEVAKKLREMGTKAGQTVQAFNILSRMTPEGMVKYAQSELMEAYDAMIKNKSQKWINEHRAEFDLNSNDVQFIMDTMKEVSAMEDGYDKKVKLAEIQKLITDKLPHDKSKAAKSWMRISMLFNPKTQVRNVMGNAIIAPVNFFGDIAGSIADKIISRKTGVRTTGRANVKAILKGFKEGAYQATNDYKKGINTKDMEGNRFEIGEGKSFNEKTIIGKSLNRVDRLLNYVMDAGDRVFSQAAFENSLQNQMVLNNTNEITQDMIDIARTESLQRTWNDNNNYTKFVLTIRNFMNKAKIPGTNGYGLGDVLIPFAKTPANLTKAIVDYSPAGMVNVVMDYKKMNKALSKGEFTPQMQHKFVQDLGKATAGTMLYVVGYALAKAHIISGESDDDKDTRDFMKNTLGVSSYSIKIGDKSFTYDWAQPIAAPLSIMANIEKSKDNKGQALLEGITSSLDSAGSILLEQSFMKSINDVLTDNNGIVSGIENAILDLPARAVPTFMKQITDLTDGTQRQTFEYKKPLETAVNKFKAKIPGLSQTLQPSVDTMGREIKKYGGKNDIFNVFLNPANVNTENISKSAEEIYKVYKQTGKKDVMPRVAPYYVDKKGEKIILNSEQRAKYQKISGDIIEDNVNKLLNSNEYNHMKDEEKAEVIKDIVNYSYNIAQKEVLGTELSQTYQKAYEYSKIGNISDYYSFENSIDKDSKKSSITNYLINSKLNNKELAYLYGKYYSTEEKLNNLLELNIPIKEFIKLDSQDLQSDYNSRTGKSISGSKKEKVINYINSLSLSIPQKAILIKSQYNTFNNYDNDIVKYVNNLNKTINDKKVLLKSIGFDNYDKDVINYINSQSLSIKDKEKKLKSLGFTIREGRVYS